MTTLNTIVQEIHRVGPATHAIFPQVLDTAQKIQASDTDGEKAQAFADALLPYLVTLIPALGPYIAIIQVCESHLGRMVNAVEQIGGTIVADLRPTLPDTGEDQTIPPE